MITQQYLKERLTYNPATGNFIWRHCNELPVSWNTKYANNLAGSINRSGYITIALNNKAFFAHRLAWLFCYGYFPVEVDHINRDKADNRLENLREASHQQNALNQIKRSNSSGYSGVSWDSTNNLWRAQLRINGKSTNLGRYSRLVDAVQACNKARESRGEFALIEEFVE